MSESAKSRGATAAERARQKKTKENNRKTNKNKAGVLTKLHKKTENKE